MKDVLRIQQSSALDSYRLFSIRGGRDSDRFREVPEVRFRAGLHQTALSFDGMTKRRIVIDFGKFSKARRFRYTGETRVLPKRCINGAN